MHVKNLLCISLFFSLFLNGCKDDAPKENFSFDDKSFREHFLQSDNLDIKINNPNNIVVDSVVYYLNEKNIGSVNGLSPKKQSLVAGKFGYQNIKALIFHQGKQEEISSRIEIVSNVEPKLLAYKVINTFLHDVNSFTEGLEFYNDTLLESTGQKKTSYIRKLDYKTGKVYKQADLEPQYFGEGITVVDGKLYQLTWQDNTGFIYNAGNMKLIKTFTFDKQIEGWGMTNNGKVIYQSDGTEKIWSMDPTTQKITDYVNVYTNSSKIKSINELEYIEGKIFGNIWQKDAIAVIDPTSGAVEAILNLAELRKQVSNKEAEVLNGIAYNPKTKTIFVTGKNWDKLFEIKLVD